MIFEEAQNSNFLPSWSPVNIKVAGYSSFSFEGVCTLCNGEYFKIFKKCSSSSGDPKSEIQALPMVNLWNRSFKWQKNVEHKFAGAAD